MKVLLLTQYFYPETGAPQNRLLGLSNKVSESIDRFDVLTAMPNYPQRKVYDKYRWKLLHKEKMGRINIFRTFIYPSGNRGAVFRLIEYISFAFSSLVYGLLFLPRYDIIIYESPPLSIGINAWILKIFKANHLVANVSDLWTESLVSLGVVRNRFIIRLSHIVEMYLYSKSNLVCCQTNGIKDHINKFQKKDNLFLFRNGADIDYIDKVLGKSVELDFRKKHKIDNNDTMILYAGNIGYAQGIDVIIDAARLLQNDLSKRFVIIGDGPEKDNIIKLSDQYGLANVTILDSMPREELIRMVELSDLFIVPLRKSRLFRGAIPSKIFEALYLRIPVLLGVEGEAHDIFVKEMKAAIPFEPENYNDLASRILELCDNRKMQDEISNNGYQGICNEFNRSLILETFMNKIGNLYD